MTKVIYKIWLYSNQNFLWKTLSVLITCFLSGAILSCGATDSFVEPPLCKEFFSSPDKERQNLIPRYSVEELITLERCGLRYHHYSPNFGYQIIRHKDYPTPYLLKELKGDNEVLNYHIIAMLRDLADSGRFAERLMADRQEIMTTANDAMSRMKSESLKLQSLDHYQRLEMFYEGVPVAK